ncbi:MAG: DUF5685 family protein [Acutalibacter sp.]
MVCQRKDERMFGYVRPFKSELLVSQYDQYKAVYCQVCRALQEHYGRLASFTLSYDCTFYALLCLSIQESKLTLHHGRCVMNPLKKCDFLKSDGEAYHRAAALSVLLTYHKLRDDLADDGFLKSLGSRLLLPLVSRKAKRAAREFPFLAQEAEKAMTAQREAEASGGGVDACAEPTANLLAALFQELSCDTLQKVALERFGYFLGRWVYLMDAADDLPKDLKEGGFNPFIERLGLSGKAELTPEERKAADEAMNQALNATAAQMLLAFQLIDLENFGPVLENVVEKGLPEIQREILFLHIREKRKGRPEPEDLP